MRSWMLLPLLASCAAPVVPQRAPADLAACVWMDADPEPDPIVVESHVDIPPVDFGVILHNDCATAVEVADVDFTSGNGLPPAEHPFPGTLAAGASFRFAFQGTPRDLTLYLLGARVVVSDLAGLGEPVTVEAHTRLQIVGPFLEPVASPVVMAQTPVGCWSEPARLQILNSGEAAATVDGLHTESFGPNGQPLPEPSALRVLSPGPDAFPRSLPPGDVLDVVLSHRPAQVGESWHRVLLDTDYDDYTRYRFHTEVSVRGDGRPRPSTGCPE